VVAGAGVTLSDLELAALVGRRFRGGTTTVERWENWLLTDCTGREPMADRLLHPVSMFHLPIRAADTSIAEMFEVVGGDGSPGSITLLGYDWEFLAPLREGEPYRGSGGVTAVERHPDHLGRASYDVTFSIELSSIAGEPVARSTIRWRVHS
jgi:hypothetical protein